jgi:hypothetical protein
MRTRRIAHLLGGSLVGAMLSGCGAEEGSPPAPNAPAPAPPADGAKLFQKPEAPGAKGKTGAVDSSPNALRYPSGCSYT